MPAMPCQHRCEIRMLPQKPKCPVTNARLCTQQKHVKVWKRHKTQVHGALINARIINSDIFLHWIGDCDTPKRFPVARLQTCESTTFFWKVGKRQMWKGRWERKTHTTSWIAGPFLGWQIWERSIMKIDASQNCIPRGLLEKSTFQQVPGPRFEDCSCRLQSTWEM